MEIFTIGGKFEVTDGKHGWAVLKYGGHTLYVNALVISENTPNYVDIVKVSNVISNAIREAQRFLTAMEVYELLGNHYGGAKVVCEELELEFLKAQNEAEKINVNFECLTIEQNAIISAYMNQLNDLRKRGLTTEKEKQYKFLTFLQGLDFLKNNMVFDVYTNVEF